MERARVEASSRNLGYLKGSLLTVEVLVMATGFALIVVAAFDIAAGTIPRAYPSVPLILIISGILAFFIAVHGFGATAAEHRLQIGLNSSLLLLLTGVHLAFFLGLLYNSYYIGHRVDDFWLDAYESKPYIIRNIEEEYQCCGLHNTTQYAFPKGDNDKCVKSPYFGYTTACYGPLKYAINRELNIVMGWVLGTGIVFLIASAIAATTMRSTPDEDERAPLLHSNIE